MTYDKETRAEEMETELREDKIRETLNELDDGAMDSWIGDNKDELLSDFLDCYSVEWVSFCRDKWNEENK
uniref:Uncharacterized protein n=1 Tax=viral metagenome TaxID=1070528 RepID=A0A6M3LUB8_9ZZZZ